MRALLYPQTAPASCRRGRRLTGIPAIEERGRRSDLRPRFVSAGRGQCEALFGCGDSASYPDSFCDALAEIRDGLEATGCTFVGALDAAEYDGCTSRICRDGKVIGLAVDDGASEAVNDARMEKWIAAVGF